MRAIYKCLVLAAAVGGVPFPLTAAAQTAEVVSSRYDLTWTSAEVPKVHVEGRLTSKDCTFGTSRKWATFFEGDEGWSRHIRDLRAYDNEGRGLPVKAIENGRWQVGKGDRCTVRLSYDVDFAFAREQWEAGNEQVAYLSAAGLYSTGLPLFIVGDDGPAEITVNLPAGWQFVTPWEQRGLRRYRATDHAILLENTWVVGRGVGQSFRAANFTVDIALLGHPQNSAMAFQQTFSTLAPQLVNLFGDNRAGRYMIVLLNGPEDGESFENSFAVATANAPTTSNRIIWANHLSHELLHYWIGKAIAPADSAQGEFKWFTEGFTEYLANRVLLDAGIYSSADFDDRMVRHMGNYLLTRQNPNFMKTSLKAAGAQGWHNRPLIYSGGATLAYCLDGQIRKASQGTRTLGTLIRRLFTRSQNGEKLTSQVFVSEAETLTAMPMESFYADYVEGVKSLPVQACAADQGRSILVQGYDVFVDGRRALP